MVTWFQLRIISGPFSRSCTLTGFEFASKKVHTDWKNIFLDRYRSDEINVGLLIWLKYFCLSQSTLPTTNPLVFRLLSGQTAHASSTTPRRVFHFLSRN